MNRRDFVTQSGAILSVAGAARSPQPQARDVVRECVPLPTTAVRRVHADGVDVFYREAGPSNAPVVLLVHGFPSSSFQYRELIPRLADHYRVIAPDLPGFGFTESIARPGNVDIQLDLFRDYQSNVQLYPPFSHIFARSGLRFWPFGARVTHPSCRQGPRPICATIRTRKSSCYFLRAHRI
jgi:hypothetical protein